VFTWVNSAQTFGLGLIASPDVGVTGWSTPGGRTFDYYFNIIGEAPDSWLIQGAQVSKVGMMSGLTRGTITIPCDTYYAYYTLGADFTCQAFTNVQAQPGDSGGPFVYGWPDAGASVYFAGLTSNSDWGANPPTQSGFSKYSAIVRDFGNVKTYPSKPCC
jgi:hypothetical protein